MRGIYWHSRECWRGALISLSNSEYSQFFTAGRFAPESIVIDAGTASLVNIISGLINIYHYLLPLRWIVVSYQEFFKEDRLKLEQVVHRPICYDVTVLPFPYLFCFFWELRRMQNIPHGITEFLSEIILCQREPNARYEICKSFRDHLEVPHQHIIVWNVWVVSTASHFIIWEPWPAVNSCNFQVSTKIEVF